MWYESEEEVTRRRWFAYDETQLIEESSYTLEDTQRRLFANGETLKDIHLGGVSLGYDGVRFDWRGYCVKGSHRFG